jgi:hypothetical protein
MVSRSQRSKMSYRAIDETFACCGVILAGRPLNGPAAFIRSECTGGYAGCGRNLLNLLRVLTPATKLVTLLRLSPLQPHSVWNSRECAEGMW